MLGHPDRPGSPPRLNTLGLTTPAMPLLPREATSTSSENQDGDVVGVSVPDAEGWGEAEAPGLQVENTTLRTTCSACLTASLTSGNEITKAFWVEKCGKCISQSGRVSDFPPRVLLALFFS